MTYCAWGCVQRYDLWAWLRKEKRRAKCHASNWLFVQNTHVHVAPVKLCMWSHVFGSRKLWRERYKILHVGTCRIWRNQHAHFGADGFWAFPLTCMVADTALKCVIVQLQCYVCQSLQIRWFCVFSGRNAIANRPDSTATDPAMDQIAPVERYDDAAAWATPTFCEIQNNVQVGLRGRR